MWFCYVENGFAIDGDGTESEPEIREKATAKLRDLITEAQTDKRAIVWLLEYEDTDA